jgi:hypothetical protein
MRLSASFVRPLRANASGLSLGFTLGLSAPLDARAVLLVASFDQP